MKLTRVEQLFDGSRLIFYYTAEGRVDFRELVRDLAAHFRTRIEMRQIGVRDEARMLGGYGSCGRPLCCTTWLQIVRAGVDQDGEAAEPEPQPVEAVGHVRPAEVLPALRAAERQRRRARRLRRRGRLRICSQPDRTGAAAACGAAAAAIAEVTGRGESRGLTSDADGMVEARASASPSAIPPASVPRSRVKAAADPAVLAVCEPVLYGPLDGAGTGGVRPRAASRPRPGRPPTTRSSRPSPTRRRAASTPWRRRRSTRKRSPRPACPGGGTRSCWRISPARSRVAMMFYADELRVVLATVHIPLADVPRTLTARAARRRSIALTAAELPRFGHPRAAARGRRA